MSDTGVGEIAYDIQSEVIKKLIDGMGEYEAQYNWKKWTATEPSWLKVFSDPFENKVILVTGGTGFIGKNLVRYLLTHHNPRKVISFSRRWADAEQLSRELNDKRLRTINGDICDEKAINSVMNGVDLALHCAAYKSIISAEYNATETVRVNVNGTINVIRAAIDNGVERVLGISTDKACDPASSYGRSKALMESLLITANNLGRTRFATCRYGNVVGSSGSVIPFFRSLLDKGESVLPITDSLMTRYWFAPNDAVQYVVRCLREMNGGETFVPKLRSSTIEDLVGAFEYVYERPIEINVVGRRPGEKSHESMVSVNERHRTYDREWTYVIEPETREWDASYQPSGALVSPDFVEDSYHAPRYAIDELVGLIRNS
jgi:UDP-N-acetylglucosamine 4,6-dehydratase